MLSCWVFPWGTQVPSTHKRPQQNWFSQTIFSSPHGCSLIYNLLPSLFISNLLKFTKFNPGESILLIRLSWCMLFLTRMTNSWKLCFYCLIVSDSNLILIILFLWISSTRHLATLRISSYGTLKLGGLCSPVSIGLFYHLFMGKKKK